MKCVLELSKKQTLAFKYLMDKNTKVIVYGGAAGGGKSWLGSSWLITMCMAYPNTRWFVARLELKKIYETTYESIRKVSRKMGLRRNHHWRHVKGEKKIVFHNGSEILFVETKLKPGDPFFERIGSTEYTGGFIEEASEIDILAYDMLRIRVHRHLNEEYGLLGKILMTCNPKKNWLYTKFYKPYENGDLPKKYAFIQSTVYDNPMISVEYINNLRDMHSEIHSERLFGGDWNYGDEPNQLIAYEWVEECFQSQKIEGVRYMGVDVADSRGADSSVIVILNGNSLSYIHQFKPNEIDPSDLANEVIYEADAHKVDYKNIAIDGDGVGAGTYGSLVNRKYDVYRVESGRKAVHTPETKEYKFNVLKSQMWWVAREALRKKEVHIGLEVNSDKGLQLISELCSVRYETKGNKAFKVEAKEEVRSRLGRSPDLADAFVYALWIRHLRRVRRDNVFSSVYHVAKSMGDVLF